MAGKNSEKDRAMAANLKAQNVRRTKGRCPLCYGLVSIPMYGHIISCKGRSHLKVNKIKASHRDWSKQ